MMNFDSSSAIQEAARQELARRELARRHLLDFKCYTNPRYRRARHLEYVAAKLEGVKRRVEAGEIVLVMLSMPPRYSKSELVKGFCAWTLGHHPDWSMMYTSYAASLAHKQSRDVRDTITSDAFSALFGTLGCRDELVELAKDNAAAHRWGIEGHRGGMLAAGVGGGITGLGFKVGVIDDPFKDRAEANSEVRRNAVWDWYRSTFSTRMEEWEQAAGMEDAGAAVLFPMTRWHEDDLAGRIERLMDASPDADRWEIIRLPAIAEENDPLGRQPGEALWPAKHSVKRLAQIAVNLGSFEWGALYQQAPRARDGNTFKLPWFAIVQAAPAQADRVRYWDKAGTEDGGDYTVGVLMAHADGVFYVEDVVRGQWSSGQRDKVMKQTAELDAQRYGNRVQIWIEQEPGSGGKDSADASIRLLAGYPVYTERATGDKQLRADPFAAQCEADNVKLVMGAWNQAYLDELTVFPSGKNDDQVDGSSGAFNKLLQSSPGVFF